jgi:hypothetical protein
MATIKQAVLDYELKRWMRPDAHRFLHPDWRRFWNAGHEDDPVYRFYESIERKFSPSQPRVPAGVPEGGQWTSEGGDGDSSNGRASENPTVGNGKPKTKIAARVSPEREAECELIRRNDEFICKAFQSRACYGQAMLRYANCLQGLPLPPLNF